MLADDLESRLRAIAQSQPELATGEDGFTIFLDRPNAFIAGEREQYDGMSAVRLAQFEVHDPIARHGIGSRLLKSFIRYCDLQNVEVITSEITSTPAMRIRRRVLG